jgi:hypothetical protein
MKKRTAFFISTALVMVSAFTSGCTYTIYARPPMSEGPAKEKIPAKAAVLLPPDSHQQKNTLSGMFWIGAAHRWELQTGDAMMGYSKKYFSQLFTQADIFLAGKKSDAIDRSYTVLAEPVMQDIAVSQSFDTTVTLHLTMKDRGENVLYQGTYTGTTQQTGILTRACLGGVFAGESALSDSFTSAMNHAFDQMAEDVARSEARQKFVAVGSGPK